MSTHRHAVIAAALASTILGGALIASPAAAQTSQYWDGTNTTPGNTANGRGGGGTWDAATTNWTTQTGNANNAWTGGNVAVFAGRPDDIGGNYIVSVNGTQQIAGITLTANSAYRIQSGSGGSLQMTAPDFTLNVPENVLAAGQPDRVELSLNLAVNGNGRLVKTGDGDVQLNVANGYTGGTLVSGGNLQVAANGALGTGAVEINGSGAKLFVTGAGVTAGGLSFSALSGGQLIFRSGSSAGSAAISVGNNGLAEVDDASLGTATITAHNGGLVAFTATAAGAGGTVIAEAGSAIDLTTMAAGTPLQLGSLSGAGQIRLGSRALTVGALNLNETISGVITGDGASLFTKTGTGTLTLSGINTYTGTTIVSGGRLTVNGSLANTAMNVSGQLAGNGSIAGMTTILSGGDLVGIAGQQLTLQNLVLANGSFVTAVLGAPSNTALFDVTGNLTLDGSLLVLGSSGFAEGTYRLFDYGGTLTNNGLVISTLPAGFNPGDWAIDTATAGRVNLIAEDGPGLQYWDGANTTPGSVANGRGGGGFWNAASTNWTNQAGTINAPWAGETAVFANNPGVGLSFTVEVQGAQTVAGMTFLAGARYNFQPGAGGAFVMGAPDFTIDVVDPDGNVIDAAINVPIQGNGRLVKTGLGSASLLTANAYTGGTLVQQGILQVRATGALGTGPVTIADTARLTFRGASAPAATGLDITVQSGGTLYLFDNGSAGNAFIHNSGFVVIDDNGTLGTASIDNEAGGEVQIAGTGTAANAAITNKAGADVDVSQADGAVGIGYLTGAGNVFLGSRALTVGSFNSDMNISGVIADGGIAGGTGGSLVKTGFGTLTLSGANTYTGGTILNSGGLVINGSVLGNLTVNGGILGGSGVIAGNVTFAGAGSLAGASGGTLDFGSLTLLASTNVNATLGAPGSTALFNVTGNLTLDGLLNVTAGVGFAAGTFRLFDYGGTLTNNGLVITSAPPGFNPGDWSLNTATNGQVSLIVPQAGTGDGIQYWDGANTTPGNVANGRGGVGTWTAATTNWTNQAGSINAPWAGGTAAFAGTNSYRVTIDAAGINAAGLNCIACSVIFDGGTLTLAADAVIDVQEPNSSIANSFSFDSDLVGLGGLTKTGRGDLFLRDDTDINGTLLVTGGGMLSVIDSTNGGATIDTHGFGLIVDGGTSSSDRSTFVLQSRSTGNTAGGIIGLSAGSVAAARVLGGSLWDAGNFDVVVGDAGNGTLQVYSSSLTNLSELRAARVILGAQASGRGTLQIWGDGGSSGIINAATIFGGVGGGNVTFDNQSSNPRANPYNLIPTLDGNLSVNFTNGEIHLAGINTYTGVTIIDRGVLILNNASLTGGGAMTVQRGVLGGNGSIAGAVTIQDAGTLEGASGQALTMGSLVLGNATKVNLTLGAPSLTALFNITGNLTLDGILNVAAGTGFGSGTYRLFNYGGTLTDGGLVITTVPVGFNPGDWSLSTATGGQVNLIVPGAGAGDGKQYWDGVNTTPGNVANGRGGNGTWNAANTNWTNQAGSINAPWAGGIAVFGQSDGSDTVTVVGNQQVGGLTFLLTGPTPGGVADYIFEAGAGGAFTVTDPDTVIDVAGNATDRVNADIRVAIGGTGGLVKQGTGTLYLGTASSYSGGTRIEQGQLNLTATGELGTGDVLITGTGATLFVDRVDASTVSTGALHLETANGGALIYNRGGDAGSSIIDNAALTVFSNNASAGSATITNRDGGQLGFTGTASADEATIINEAGGAIDFSQLSGFAAIGVGSLSGDGDVFLGDSVLALGGLNQDDEIGGVIADGPTSGGSLIKEGTGTLTLSGTNSYTGLTTLNSGRLLVDGGIAGNVSVNGGILGGTGTIGGTVTFVGSVMGIAPPAGAAGGIGPAGAVLQGQSGATLTIGGLVLASSTSVNVTLGAPSATALFNVLGNLTLDGTLNVTGAAGFGDGVYRIFSYGGTLTDNGMALGTLPGSSSGEIQTSVASQVNLVVGGGTGPAPNMLFWDGSQIVANNIVDGGTGTWNTISTNWTSADGSANQAWPGIMAIFQGTSGAVTVDNGPGQVGATGMQFASNGWTVSGGAIALSGAAALRVGDGTGAGAGYTATIGSVLSGGASVTKTDLGTLILTGANTYTGGTTISAGTLQLGNGGTQAATLVGGIVNNATLAFNREGAQSYGNLISGSGQVQVIAGLVSLTADNSYTGLTTVNAGATLQLGDDTATGSIAGDLLLQGGAIGGQVVWRRTADTVYAGTISGSGFFVMSGLSGDVTLTGNSSGFTGRTDVAAGTLIVNGSLGGTVNIQRDGALTGTGSVGDTTIATGFGQAGMLIGQSGATLTLASLVLTTGAEVNVALGAPASTALFNVTGNLTLDGTLNVSNAGGFGDGVYRVFSYGGTLTDNGMALGTLPGSSTGQIQTSVANQVNLIVGGGTGPAPTMLFWDGSQTTANGAVDGGAGTWNATATNWTNADGSANQAWPGIMAIFQGTSGAVTVDGTGGPISATGIQFASNGWTVSGDPVALTGTATIRVGDGTAAGSGYTATIGSALTGSGSLSKTDLGTLILTGASSFTGGTAVNGGTLVMNGSLAGAVTVMSNARLGGTGTVGNLTIGTGGTVAPGNSIGTLSVNGNYVQAANSTYLVEINPAGQSDRIQVSGTATIQGGTVSVTKAPGTYIPGTRFTIVNAVGGVTGTYASLTQDMPFVDLALAYDANNVFLDVARNTIAFCAVAASRNQCATGNGVESLTSGTLYNAVVSLPDDAAARTAFDALSGDIYASARGAMLADVRLPRNAVLSRLATAGEGNGAWARGLGNWGSQDSDGNAFGLDRDTAGLIVGADFSAGANWRFGLSAGYTRSSLDSATGMAEADLNGTHVLAYAGGAYGPVRIRAGLGYADFDLDVNRAIAFAGFTDTARGKTGGSALQGFAELGYAVDLGGGEFEPFAGLTAVRLRSDAFSETGGPAALSGARISDTSSYSTLGARIGTAASANFVLNGSVAWRHAFGGVVPEARLAFAGGDDFTLAGTPLNRDEAAIEAGAAVRVAPGLTLGVRYDGTIGSWSSDHSVQGSLNFRF